MPITEIGPPDVKHDENSMQIIYLSTSMGSRIMENVSFSSDVHQRIPYIPSTYSVSTSVEP